MNERIICSQYPLKDRFTLNICSGYVEILMRLHLK